MHSKKKDYFQVAAHHHQSPRWSDTDEASPSYKHLRSDNPEKLYLSCDPKKSL